MHFLLQKPLEPMDASLLGITSPSASAATQLEALLLCYHIFEFSFRQYEDLLFAFSANKQCFSMNRRAWLPHRPLSFNEEL